MVGVEANRRIRSRNRGDVVGIDQDKDRTATRPQAIVSRHFAMPAGNDDSVRKRSIGVRPIGERGCVEPSVNHDHAAARNDRANCVDHPASALAGRTCEKSALSVERRAGFDRDEDAENQA